ncbi:MAG: hypothetical protein ACYCV7_10320 [Acidimicrobiales bacterium]
MVSAKSGEVLPTTEARRRLVEDGESRLDFDEAVMALDCGPGPYR